MPNSGWELCHEHRGFHEPTNRHEKSLGLGTISRLMREQCLDSTGNDVLAYDTTGTAPITPLLVHDCHHVEQARWFFFVAL